MIFSEWITGKYVEWRGGKVGRDASILQFANLIGVTEGSMGHWMNGRRTPGSPESLSALFSFFGSEVYKVLGITPPPLTSIDARTIPSGKSSSTEHQLQVKVVDKIHLSNYVG